MEKRKRSPYEFNKYTKEEAFRRAHGRCEDCGISQDEISEPLEAHHILPIYIAIQVPALSLSVIKSLANCEMLCPSCHDARHSRRKKPNDYKDLIYSLIERDTMPIFEEYAVVGV